MDITQIEHPEYQDTYIDWQRWRDAYYGGRKFINLYLQQFSSIEDKTDFEIRRMVSYCPRFAGAAIDDVKNSIYQRLVDITREGGTQTYRDACAGGQFGVDLLGSS